MVRTPTASKVEVWINETCREQDVLISHLVDMSAKEVDLPFVREEILDTLAHIKTCVYNPEFRGTIVCLPNALSELCKAKDIKMLKGPEYVVRLCLQEEEIRMTNLTTQ